MSEYEKVWSEGRFDSNGRVIISPGYVYSPVSVDSELEKFLSEIERCLIELNKEENERVQRYVKCFIKWFDLINAYKNDNGIRDIVSPHEFIDVDKLRDLAIYVEYTDVIDFSTAKNQVLPLLWNNFTEETTWQIIEKLGILDKTDSSEIDSIIDSVFSNNQDEVDKHKSGKKDMSSFFMGQVMRTGKVKANPKELNELIKKKLESQ